MINLIIVVAVIAIIALHRKTLLAEAKELVDKVKNLVKK
jgi:molybdopterin synthase catalytic subunit